MKITLCRDNFVPMVESIEWKNHPDLVSAITYLDEVENAIIEYSNFKISNEVFIDALAAKNVTDQIYGVTSSKFNGYIQEI